MKNRLFSIAAVAAMVGVAACGGADEAAVDGQVVDTDTEMVTTSDTTMAPVVAPVVTTDTAAVQTTTVVEADTSVNTTVIEDPAVVAPTTVTP